MADAASLLPEMATCRGCGRGLRGKAYHLGGSAYHPVSGNACPSNFYGGYVCSRECDFRASRDLERTMPGHGYDSQSISSYARERINRNWSEER